MKYPVRQIYKHSKDGKTMTNGVDTLPAPATSPLPTSSPVSTQVPMFDRRDKYFHLTKYYLAYGSNLHLTQMAQRCRDAKGIAPIHLPNFRLVFRGVADIEPHKGSVVHGAVYEISEADERALDRYEGYPTMYRKEYISAKLRGEPVVIMYYTMNNDRISPPSNGYYNTIDTGFENWKLDKQHLIAALDHSHQKFDTARAEKILATHGLVVNAHANDDDPDDDPDGTDGDTCEHEQTIVDDEDQEWCLTCGSVLAPYYGAGDELFWEWTLPVD